MKWIQKITFPRMLVLESLGYSKFLFYKGGYWGSGRSSDLPKVTQQITGRVKNSDSLSNTCLFHTRPPTVLLKFPWSDIIIKILTALRIWEKTLFRKYFSRVCLRQRERKCTLRNEKPKFFSVRISRSSVFSSVIQNHPDLKWATVKRGFLVPGSV